MAELRVAKEGENVCLSCKHNCIKIMMGMKFEDGIPCTGYCTHPENHFYHNSVCLTCDLWEVRDEART